MRDPELPRPAREAAAVAVLLLVAVLLRWARWAQTAVLFEDGPEFLGISRRMAEGDWASALSHPYHPLYPLLTALAHRAGADWETAAVLVSVAGGSAGVLFLYLFLRESFGWPAAWLGAALLAVHYRAVSYASDVQSDGLYLGLFLAALWLLRLALERRSWRLAGGAGVASGLAYLTRPEGLVLCAAGAVLAVARALRGRWSVWELGPWLAALALGAALLATPYALALRSERGSWVLSQKKSPTEMLGALGLDAPLPADARTGEAGAKAAARARRAGPAGHPLRAFNELVATARSAARAETLVVLALGLLAVLGRPGERGALLGALVLCQAVLLYLLVLDVGYVSRRHALPALVALFGYAGLGISVLGGLLLWPLRALGRGPTAGLPPWSAAALGLVVVASVALGHQLLPRRSEDLAERRAAEWLREAVVDPGGVAGGPQAAYYAGGDYVPLEKRARANLPAVLRERGVRYVVTDDPKLLEALRHASGAGVRLLHSEATEEAEAQVFEVEPRPAF